jgi:hypothetical protein
MLLLEGVDLLRFMLLYLMPMEQLLAMLVQFLRSISMYLKQRMVSILQEVLLTGENGLKPILNISLVVVLQQD